MGAEGNHGSVQPFIGRTFDLSVAPVPSLACTDCRDKAVAELEAITRPRVWLHRDTWTWKPWVGHWYQRVTIVLGRLCIDVCRCRCRSCRWYVARLREAAGE